MAYNNNILLGRITKLNGYEGAVTVKLEKIFSENIPEIESVFLEVEGRPVPFFISGLEYSGADILKLQFEGYNSIEKANEFIGCRVFLTQEITGDKHTEVIESFIGYQVLIRGGELLGAVSEVIPNPAQWLLNIISEQKKNYLIPLHEDFIVSIDKKKKILILDIPEGLTEIN